MTLFSNKGITLIESILAMAILAAGLIGVMVVFVGGTSSSLEANTTVVAANLAREKLEEIIADRATHGYATALSRDYTDNPGGNYSNYTRTVTITEVDNADLTTSELGSGYARVVVVVTWGGPSGVQLETLIADYP